jgi:glycogen(starch) synthase
MRILLTTDIVGGVWDHTVSLARALHRAGHQLLVAAIGEPRDDRLARLPAGIEYAGRRYRLEWMADAGEDVPAAAAWLRSLAEAWAADVVHLNQMAYSACGMPAPTVVAVHSDVLSWFSEVRGEPAPPEWKRYAEWVRNGLRAADEVVAPTEYRAALVRRHYGAEGVAVVPNGVDSPGPVPEGGRDLFAITVGRLWDAGKGADVLDEAARRLAGAVPSIHALGETVSPEGGGPSLRGLRCWGRVPRAEVDAALRRSRVYVAPSRYEPFGLAPLEAALHGCALVLSDIGSFRELWDGCAEFVPAEDSAALAAALRGLHEDPARVERLAAAARRRALRRYGADAMAEGYLRLYQGLRPGGAREPRPEAVAGASR